MSWIAVPLLFVAASSMCFYAAHALVERRDR